MFHGGFGGFHHQQQQPQRSAENLYGPDSPVASLKQGKFPGHDARHVWFVEFYAPWCNACAALKPAWEALVGDLEGLVKVGAVNCEVERALCATQSATSFPTLKLFRGGASVTYEAGGDRGREALRAWALEQLPGSAVTPLSPRRPETLDAFLAEAGPCAKAARKRLAAAAALGEEAEELSDAPCFVVLHREAATPPWLKALAFGLRARTALAEARGPGVELVAGRLGLGEARAPAVIAVCGGDVARTLAAPGAGEALSRDRVETFVEHTLHSRACRGVAARVKPPLSTATDYGRLRIAELRALLASRDDRCDGCVEKGDFVAALRGHAAAEEAAGSGGHDEL